MLQRGIRDQEFLLIGNILSVCEEEIPGLRRFVREGVISGCEGRRRNYRWVMRLALPDGTMFVGYGTRSQQAGGHGDGTFVAV